MIQTYAGRPPRIAPSAYIANSADVIGDVEIGENSSIWFAAVLRGDIEPIRIGANSNIQDGSVVHTMLGSPVVVGDWVTVGHRAVLHGCTIESHCLIGMGAILLNDVRVGEGSIIAAGALVPEKTVIPRCSLYLGMPARFKRELTESDQRFIHMHAAHYLEYKEVYLAERAKARDTASLSPSAEARQPGYPDERGKAHGKGLALRAGASLAEVERRLIQETLRFTRNNKTRAAEMLGITRKTLHVKLKEYESQQPATDDESKEMVNGE